MQLWYTAIININIVSYKNDLYNITSGEKHIIVNKLSWKLKIFPQKTEFARIRYSDIFISCYFFSISMGILINEKRESYIRTGVWWRVKLKCCTRLVDSLIFRVCNFVDFISLAFYWSIFLLNNGLCIKSKHNTI